MDMKFNVTLKAVTQQCRQAENSSRIMVYQTYMAEPFEAVYYVGDFIFTDEATKQAELLNKVFKQEASVYEHYVVSHILVDTYKNLEKALSGNNYDSVSQHDRLCNNLKFIDSILFSPPSALTRDEKLDALLCEVESIKESLRAIV